MIEGIHPIRLIIAGFVFAGVLGIALLITLMNWPSGEDYFKEHTGTVASEPEVRADSYGEMINVAVVTWVDERGGRQKAMDVGPYRNEGDTMPVYVRSRDWKTSPYEGQVFPGLGIAFMSFCFAILLGGFAAMIIIDP